MRIAFVVNDVDTEVPTAATTVMAHSASRLGHDVFMIGVRDLEYFADGRVGGSARRAVPKAARTQATFLRSVQGTQAPRDLITTDDLDVLWLRYNPSQEVGDDAWAQDEGILFGRLAVERGVLVLDDPDRLTFTTSKLYFQHFPESVRPRTIVTRSLERIQEFHEEQGAVVLKPLVGYGGEDVYLVKKDGSNLRQLVEALARKGYIIAQEFLPAAKDGDIRLFVMNGKALMRDGRYAAVHRVNPPGDFRSNMTAGGTPKKARVTHNELLLVEKVRPRLVADGLFLVGLDIVGDKLVEVNTISPGGLNIAGKLEGVNFGEEVVRAIERKVRYREYYGGKLSNRQLVSMD
jgi:glutathione synthase